MYPILKDKFTPRECKITIYKAVLKPILLYGAETWALTTKTKSRIQAAEMRVLRLIRGLTRRDRIRNVHIRRMLGIQPLLEDIERSRLRLYGHLKWMNEGRLPRKYLDWQPERKRPVGRPRKRWKEGVDEALRRKGTSLMEVEEGRDFDDRDGWRQLLRMLPADR